jgi:THO complex subunit 2
MQKDMAKYESNMKEKAIAAQSSGLPSMGDVPARGTQAPAPTSKSRPSTIEGTRSNTPRDPPNQKYGLLRSLLTMGALRPALFILSKFPWLSNSHPEIADLFLHMIRTSLAPICEPISPSAAKIRAKSRPNLDRIIIETGCAPKFVPKKKLIVVHAPTPPSNMYTDYTYFYPAWLDTVPLCTTRREIFSVIQPMLRYVRVNAYRDISVLTQLCRIGKAELSEVSFLSGIGFPHNSCSPFRPKNSETMPCST